MDREIRISITAGTIVKTVLIVVAAWALYALRDIALIVLTAIVISSAIEPGVIGLVKRRIPRVLAILLIYLVFFLVFFVIFYFFLPTLLEDFGSFVSSMPLYLDAFSRSDAFNQYAHILGVSNPSSVSATDIWQNIRDSLSITTTFSNAFTAVSTIFGGVFSFILVVIFSFYFAVVETGVDGFLRVIVPKSDQEYVLGLWRRSQKKIGQWMQGQLILAVLMGIFVFLALKVFSVPHALVLAVIAAVFEIIPVFGPTLAAVPAVLIGFATGGPFPAMGIALLYILLQQFENHLIYPLVVTRVVGVPPLLVILALIVGGELAGFLGIILAVPLAATIQELAKDIESGVLFGDNDTE